MAQGLEAARSTENAECHVQGNAFFTQSLCTRYFAFEFTLDIVFLRVYLKQANNTYTSHAIKQTTPSLYPDKTCFSCISHAGL